MDDLTADSASFIHTLSLLLLLLLLLLTCGKFEMA